MRIEGRVFRGLLEVLVLWAKTSPDRTAPGYCRLEAEGPDVLAVEFPTQAGWLRVTVPAAAGDEGALYGVDLPLLLKVLKAASWPRVEAVGDVELEWTDRDLRVTVPNWRQARSGWVEAAPAFFAFPLNQGICCQADALPAAPPPVEGVTVVMEPAALAAAVSGAASCVAGSADRGVLQCVELVCRADELLGLSTDGAVAAIASEPVALGVEEQVTVPLPPATLKVVLALWEKLQLQGDLVLKVAEGGSGPVLEISPQEGGPERMRVALRLMKGHLPLDMLEGLPESTKVAMGQVECREALLSQLELAELNPAAKVAWLVWEEGRLMVCSHGPFMDMREPVALTAAPKKPAEIAINTDRLRNALQQLKASGGVGPISLYLDQVQRPTRVLMRQLNPVTGQVRRVVVMGTAGTSYETFRARAAELVATAQAEQAKQRRRDSYNAPISA
jgi:hypothetical protein